MDFKERGFRTRVARNNLFCEIMRNLRLCSSQEDIVQIKKDYEEELKVLIEDDQYNDPYGEPIYPRVVEAITEKSEQLKREENYYGVY